jgi:hypothetical protein
MTDTERAMLDECLASDHGLTDWEITFIESLDKHWRDQWISDRQLTCLESINHKVLNAR